jgi:hypothetical protein
MKGKEAIMSHSPFLPRRRPEFSERCRSLKEAAQLSLEEIEGFDQLSERVLTQVVLASIRTYQQKVAVGIEDSASDLLDTFKKNVTKQIFDTAAGWRAVQRDNFLYPRGCRFCFQKGNNTIVVIEQEPQVRTLSFMAGMQGDDQDLERSDQSERAFLSLPYSLFVFSFKDDMFLNVRCYWRTEPLKSLTDTVHCCVLPNIHVGGMVCLGTGTISGNISDVCESILAQFWASQFNMDLADEWWGKGRLAPAIATGRAWQEYTRTNPLFILQVPFRIHKTLKEVIEQVANGEEPSESSFRHKVSTDIDSCVAQLFHKISSYLNKTKFEKHSPKDIKESLRDHLRTSVFELIDIVVSLNHEINKLAVESEPDRRPIKQAGVLWNSRQE